MIEDGFYIGIVHNRLVYGSLKYELTIRPLMKWDKDTDKWLDIDTDQLYELFPDRGFVIWSEAISEIWRGHVLKFKICQNKKYIQNDFTKNAKLSVDKNYFYTLCEIIRLNFSDSEFYFRQALLDGKFTYNKTRNSECFLHFDNKKYFGPLKLIENGKSKINPYGDSLNAIQIRQINQIDIIKPIQLNNRIFVDLNHEHGELLYYSNWQSEPIFIIRLIYRLRQHLEKSKNSNFIIDADESKNLTQQKNRDKAILQRLQEQENMNNLKQEDISSIIELLMVMEPFHSKLEEAKELHLKKCREELRTQAQQEKSGIEDKIETLKRQYEDIQHKIDNQHTRLGQLLIKSDEELEYKNIEKSHLENQISSLESQADQLEKSIDLQQDRINQVLIEFEHSLSKRLNQLASEPTGILAEALANDAFLQFLLGKRERSLDLGSYTKPQINKPNFEIKQGTCFETIEEMITSYSSRLEKSDLNAMLAVWTMTITLSGLTPVFKGNAVRRALSAFINHLAYGRCFELPLSPEIISIERLFTIGQTDNASSPGILDSAILCAATHRESLFILVLDGLDRAPSQYFLGTLLDWYTLGLLNMPGDTFLSQHLEELRKQYGLANDIVSWPSNLLLAATINGLNDGFPISNNLLGKIIEIETEYEGKHQDIHPQILDQIALKPAGEVTANQLNEWREETLNQDIEPANEMIESFPKDYQPNTGIQETIRRLFTAALNICMNCEILKEDAINNAKLIIRLYFFPTNQI